MEYRHDIGEISMGNIDLAGMVLRRMRLANLVPEVRDHTIRSALSPYGEMKEVLEDTWSKAYRYKVYIGVRIDVTNLKKIFHQI